MISRTVDHSGPLFLISSLFPLLSSGTVDHSGPLFLLLLPSSLSGFQEQSIIPVHSSCYPLPLLEFLNSRSFRSTLQNSFLFPLFLSLLLSSRILLCGTLAHSPFYFISLHFFKKDYSLSSSLLCPHGFQQFLPSISPQFLPTIFSLISTDLHRFILPFSLFLFAIFYLAPSLQDLHKSSQIFHRSFKDLSKSSFLHPFLLGTWTVGHSGPLSSFPQIFTDLHRFILPFTPYLSIFYPSLYLQDLHRSSTDLSKIFQKFPFLHPLSLGPGQSVIPAHSSDLQAFRFPPFLI